MGSTGGATNVQTESISDAVGHLMSHNPITPEGQAAMEPWSLANTMWFHGQFLPEHPGTGVLSFQTTESFEQTEGYSDFIVPGMEDLTPTINMTAPGDVPVPPWPNLMAQPQPNVPQNTLGVPTLSRPVIAFPPGESWNSRQDPIILPTQSVSVSFNNQSEALLPAPQSSFLDILSQSPSETLEPLDVLPTCPTQQIPISDTSTRAFSTALIQESVNGPHYPEIMPAKRKNDEDLHSLGRPAKHLRGPGGRKGPSGVPDSCLVTFSVKRAQEPRKKTKNACLNCIWNRKGCSETTPCVNCLCNGTRGGIPQTLCIKENITELNIFKRSDTYVVWRIENTPIFGPGSFRDLGRFWDRAYDTMVETATWSDDPDLSLEVLGQYQFSNRCRHIIVFLLRFLQHDIDRDLEHYEGQNSSVSTAFARRLFAGIQGNIRELPKLRLEDFLDLLFELRCLEQLLEAYLGFHGMDPDDEMTKHLQNYLRDVVKILEERIKVDNPNVARYRLLRAFVSEISDLYRRD
ncbi:hypothetical protein BHE90_005221 [Fusarium euwallaceae]|uniref:Zn(2)-C6 fungal-type domain-containing protein n=1 Tax=Fusarium euwallaceae TaxID=1147111 RepID=A0A430LWW0_9HYPO|nr:hypothetical protein BHE90_005221 [Fusarium euwallaceae]